MALFRVGPLPDDPLAAAARFHAEVLPEILATPGESLLIVFPPADHAHRGWRVAVVQSLARARAPGGRVNAVEAGGEAGGEAGIAAAARWLDQAPGITGGWFPLDGNGAGEVISSAA